MATAVATPALASATRAFAREPRACKTLIAADFGSRTRGSARAPATRAALGARAGARAATHVLRARVAGGMEWNDETNGETNDDDTTEREATRHNVGAGDDTRGERRAETNDATFQTSSESKTQKYDEDDAESSRSLERNENDAFSPRSRSSDENWLDDDRFGCSPGQLWVNAVASIGATQNPKHASYAADFLKSAFGDASPEKLAFGTDPGGIPGTTQSAEAARQTLLSSRHQETTEWLDPNFFLNAWHDSLDARAAELRFVMDHPLGSSAALVALGLFFLSASRRARRARELRASLLNDGVDLTHVFGDHLETLEYLARMRERGALALGVEACAARKVETETKYLGAAALRDWREFYGARGIDLATKEDVRKVKAYVEHLHHLEGCLLGEDRAGEKIELLGEEW